MLNWTFLEHFIDASSTQVDPGKIQTIVRLPAPINRKYLKRMLGMVNYLGKFSAK